LSHLWQCTVGTIAKVAYCFVPVTLRGKHPAFSERLT
jgi:hypothetical protein